jgi:UrcA family protein
MTRIPTTSRSRLIAGIGVFTAAAAFLTSSGRAAAAQPVGYLPSVALHYTARDLSTDKAIRKLYGRIAHAAEQVCPQYIEGALGSLETQRIVESCRQQAIARAIQQVRNPRLADVGRRMRPPG